MTNSNSNSNELNEQNAGTKFFNAIPNFRRLHHPETGELARQRRKMQLQQEIEAIKRQRRDIQKLLKLQQEIEAIKRQRNLTKLTYLILRLEKSKKQRHAGFRR